MTPDLIVRIKQRALNPATQPDLVSSENLPVVGSVVAESEISLFERRVGFPLHPTHRDLFLEIGNGGFGPGYGLIGLPGGYTDPDGRSHIELHDVMWSSRDAPGSPWGVLPLWDWGGPTWSCLDEASGSVLTVTERGFVDTGKSLDELLSAWASGVSLLRVLFEWERVSTINPLTKQRIEYEAATGPIGVPYMLRKRPPADGKRSVLDARSALPAGTLS